MNVNKSRGKRIFEIVHWPFELPPNLHRPTCPFGWQKCGSLDWPSKGQRTISKIFFSLISSLFIEKDIFFQRHVLPVSFQSQNLRCGMKITLFHVIILNQNWISGAMARGVSALGSNIIAVGIHTGTIVLFKVVSAGNNFQCSLTDSQRCHVHPITDLASSTIHSKKKINI